MLRVLALQITFFAASLLAAPSPLHAAWTANGVPVCEAVNAQLSLHAVPDGSGGAIIVWQDNRSPSDPNIYIQRVAYNGAVKWELCEEPNGVPVCEAGGAQRWPQIIPDGSDGAIVAWTDWRLGTGITYVQRVGSNGRDWWCHNGLPVVNQPSEQLGCVLASNGSEGAIIAWADWRSGNLDIYAQLMRAYDGQTAFMPRGTPICTAPYDQTLPAIIPDGAGGAIIAWMDYRSGGTAPDIYAQRVNASGIVQWATNGVPICSNPRQRAYPSMVSDDSGGAIIAFVDWPGSDPNISAQRIDADGVALWGANGVSVCAAPNMQGAPLADDDGLQGAVIAWMDYRSGEQNPDIYAQRLNANGSALWDPNGKAICAASGAQIDPTIAADGSGGSFVAWQDFRAGGTYKIYAQRIQGNGQVLWAPDGVAICATSDHQTYLAVVPALMGAAILAWEDRRNEIAADVYALRVDGEFVYADAQQPQPPPAMFLSQNHPNPFNPSTRIAFGVPALSYVSLRVYDVSGRRVRTITEGMRQAGRYEELWDGKGDGSEAVASGVYFLRLSVGSSTATRKMVLAR